MARAFRIVAALIVLIGFGWSQVYAQVPMTGAGRGAPAAGGGGYTGPGDLATFSGWWGLRGYNGAFSGNAANICLPSDTTCANATISAGNIVLPGSLSTCNNSTVICSVKTLFDQTGNANDITNATEASRPKYVIPLAGNGCPTTALPCMAFNGSNFLHGTITTITQQFSISAIAQRTGNTASFNPFLVGATNGVWFNNSANNAILFAGSVSATVSASDSAYHSFEAVFNGASSILMIDGTDTTGLSPGVGSFSTSIGMGDDGAGGNFLTGNVTEGGAASGGFTPTQRTNLCHNKRLYWTLSGTC